MMNRQGKYEIGAGTFAANFTVVDLSFEFMGAAVVTIEVRLASSGALRTFSVGIKPFDTLYYTYMYMYNAAYERTKRFQAR